MPIDFPDNPGLTPTYQYTYNGITQNWSWDNGASAWIAQGFTITSGIPLDSIFDLSDVTGQNYNFAANNPSYLKWNLSTSSWTPDRIILPDIEGTSFTTLNLNDVLTYYGGAWTNRQIPSFNYGQIAGGGVSMTKSPKFAIVAGDSSVTITGITSDAGITLTITGNPAYEGPAFGIIASSTKRSSDKAMWNYLLFEGTYNGLTWDQGIKLTESAKNLLEFGNTPTTAYGISVLSGAGVTLSGFTGFSIKPVPDGTIVEVLIDGTAFFFSAPNPIDGTC